MVDQRHIPKIDLILGYFLDYYSPRHSKVDRVVSINENVMQTMGQIILSCIVNERGFFENLISMRSVTDQLIACMEFQMITNHAQDIVVLKLLYKFFMKAII